MLKKLKAGNEVGRVGQAETKIMVFTIYYILLGVLGLVGFTYHDVKSDNNRTHVTKLFLCESAGNLQECEGDLFSIQVIRYTSVIAMGMLALLPVMTILFSFKLRACKKTTRSN